MREISIARARGRRVEDLLQVVEVSYSEGEAKDVVALEAATSAWNVAVDDADGRRVKYIFKALGEALPDREPPEITRWERIVDTDEEDEPTPSTRAEGALLVRESRLTSREIGEQYVKLMKETNGMHAIVGQTLQKLSDAVASQDGKRHDVRLAELEMEFRKEEKAAEILARMQRSKFNHDTLRTVSAHWAGVGEVLAGLLMGKAIPGSMPSEGEIRTIFEAHDDLRDLALQIIKPQNVEHRGQIMKAFRIRWFSLSETQQGTIMAHAMAKLGEIRGMKIAAWVAQIMKETAEAG